MPSPVLARWFAALPLLLPACDQTVVGTARGEWSVHANRWAYTPVVASGCLDDKSEIPAVMPVAGTGEVAGRSNIRECEMASCGSREAAVDRHCQTGTCSEAQVAQGRCSRSDKGRTVELCDPPGTQTADVQGLRCTWDTWEWKLVDQEAQDGTDFNPPPVSGFTGPLEPLEKAEVSEDYVVHVEAAGRTSDEHCQNREHFLMYSSGQVTAVAGSGSTLLTEVRPIHE